MGIRRRRIRNSAPASGCERCYAPDELEREKEKRYLQNGIPFNADTLTCLAGCERALGII